MVVNMQLPRAVGPGEAIDLVLKHENEAYHHRRIRACQCHSKQIPFTQFPIEVLRQHGIEVSYWMDSNGYSIATIRCVKEGTPFSELQLKFSTLSSCLARKLGKFYSLQLKVGQSKKLFPIVDSH